jgi:hypothetical protein
MKNQSISKVLSITAVAALFLAALTFPNNVSAQFP